MRSLQVTLILVFAGTLACQKNSVPPDAPAPASASARESLDPLLDGIQNGCAIEWLFLAKMLDKKPFPRELKGVHLGPPMVRQTTGGKKVSVKVEAELWGVPVHTLENRWVEDSDDASLSVYFSVPPQELEKRLAARKIELTSVETEEGTTGPGIGVDKATGNAILICGFGE